jgi:hypothetical protein
MWPVRLVTLKVHGRRTGRLTAIPVIIANHDGDRLRGRNARRCDVVGGQRARGDRRGVDPFRRTVAGFRR